MTALAGNILVRVGADLSNFESGMARVEGRMRTTGRSSRLLMPASLAVAGLGLHALNAAGQYEQAMNVFQATSKASGREMKQVGDLAKALGRDITLPATSAKDAADAMTELAKGGLTVKDTMAAAKGVLQLSAAAQISNADAATITARALNSFKLSGNAAVHVADVLANAANKSTGEITDFGLALQQSSAVAHQAGLTIEETTATLMSLAQAGIVGSDAGTSLKTMLMRLVPTSKEARDAMHELGVDVFDAHGKFVGIRATIGQYHDALAKLTPEQRQLALQTIFGLDAIRAANIVMGEGVASFDGYRRAASQSGSASDLAAAKMKGFKGSVEAFKSTVETLEIELGSKLLPAATRAMGGLTQFVNSTKALKASGFVVAAWATLMVAQFAKVRLAALSATLASAGLAGALLRLRGIGVVTVGLAFATDVGGIRSFIGSAFAGKGRTSEGAEGRPTVPARVHVSVPGPPPSMQTRGNIQAPTAKELGDFLSQSKRHTSMIRDIRQDADRSTLADLQATAAKIAGMRARFDAEDRAAAVVRAKATLEDARKEGEGVTAAERDLERARGEVKLAALEKRADQLRKAYEREQKLARENAEKVRQSEEAAARAISTAWDRVRDKALRAFDATTAAFAGPAQAKIAAIEERRRQEDLAEAVADAQDRLREAREGDDPAEIVRAERDLARAREDIQLDSLRRQAEQQQAGWEQQRASLRERLDERLTTIGAHFEAEGTTWGTSTAAVVKTLRAYGVDFAAAGRELGERFTVSLREAISEALSIRSGAPLLSGRFTASGLAARAHGGPVAAGASYLVGEHGPEVFTPATAGQVTPAGGGGFTGDVYLDRDKVGQAIYQWLVSESRVNGALFSRTAGVTT